MADGKTHAFGTMAATVVLAVNEYSFGVSFPVLMAMGFGCLAGLVITPDLDVRGTTISQGKMDRMGCLIGAIWRVLWIPYAYIIPRHRHWLSHFPVISTLLRCTYIYAAVFLFLWLLDQPLAIQWWMFPAFVGLSLSDGVHALLDYPLK